MHVNLGGVLGEEYEELYRNYDDDVKKITDWIKDARREISSRKIKHERVEKEEMARKERKDIKAEEKYFSIRVEQCLSTLAGENAVFIEDIEKNISEVKHLMEIHTELYSKIEYVFGEDYEEDFGDKYRKTSISMNQSMYSR